MALPPPKHNEIGAFYLVFGLMELSAGLGYTTPIGMPIADARWKRLIQQEVTRCNRGQKRGYSRCRRADEIRRSASVKVALRHPRLVQPGGDTTHDDGASA